MGHCDVKSILQMISFTNVLLLVFLLVLISFRLEETHSTRPLDKTVTQLKQEFLPTWCIMNIEKLSLSGTIFYNHIVKELVFFWRSLKFIWEDNFVSSSFLGPILDC